MLGIGPCAFIAEAEKARTRLRVRMRRFFISFFIKKVSLPLLAGEKPLIK